MTLLSVEDAGVASTRPSGGNAWGEAAVAEVRQGATEFARFRIPDADGVVGVLDGEELAVGREVRLILPDRRLVDPAQRLAGGRLPHVQHPFRVHEGGLFAVRREG